MIEDRQQAYLEAMGIPIWSARQTSHPQAAVIDHAPGLKLGPGRGGILLICGADTEPASKLSNDISRSLADVPVWAWPDGNVDSVKPGDAVDENLFTTVAVFGGDLAKQFFGREFPDSLNSASLVLLPAMHDLETRADARRELWMILCRYGMVARVNSR